MKHELIKTADEKVWRVPANEVIRDKRHPFEVVGVYTDAKKVLVDDPHYVPTPWQRTPADERLDTDLLVVEIIVFATIAILLLAMFGLAVFG